MDTPDTDAPTDLPTRLRAALAETDPAARWSGLAAAVAGGLDYPQTLQADKALQRAACDGGPDLPVRRLALLSSCTTDHLLPAMRVAAFQRGLWLETFQGGFGLYRQELLQPEPRLAAFDPDYVLLSVSARGLLASVPVTGDLAEVRDAVARELEELKGLWRRARESLGAAVIQQSFLDVSTTLFGSHDRLVAAAPTRIVHELNHALLDAVAEEDVLLLDVAAESRGRGLDHWFDANRWLQGKLEIAPAAAPSFGDMVARVVGAQAGLSRKCLVLDLDNTLWGGVIGDDGVEGIVLGEGSARGEAHLELQRYARQLKDRGVILAVCSKNEESVARDAFERHPEMVLTTDDIAAFVANWQDKAANLTTIARQLNIGVDSLVFVDDNPVERARVREALPAVAVPELGDDPAGYVDCIVRGGYFEAVNFTAEDVERASQYAANARRASLESSAGSMDEFLAGLDMKMTYGSVGMMELPRAAQLVNKTNQFNTTGLRMTQDEMASLLADDAWDVLYFRLSDRFGDNGLVSVLIGRRSEDGATLEVVNWVMSCRVFGRQFDQEIMNVVAERALAKGAGRIRATHRRTEKNGVIADLYERLGFARSDGDDDTSEWVLVLDEFEPVRTHIAAEVPN